MRRRRSDGIVHRSMGKLGDIIWGEVSEVDDHIVPYPKGNEGKPLVTSGDYRKKQFIQGQKPVKLADQKRPKSYIFGIKMESSTQCNTNEALPAPGAEIDSWPGSPLTNVTCDGGYGRNFKISTDMQVTGTEMPKFDSGREDAAQSNSRPRSFVDECDEKENGGFLEYSWENIGTFDDFDNMFRNDEPIFGRESLGDAELWSSSADLFSSPTKSFPICSPNSGMNASSVSEHEMKQEFVQHEDHPLTSGFGRTNDLVSCDIKDVDLSKDQVATKECFHLVDPTVDYDGGKSKTLLEEKTNTKMMETTEAWRTHPARKVLHINLKTIFNGSGKSLDFSIQCRFQGNHYSKWKYGIFRGSISSTKCHWFICIQVNGKRKVLKYPENEECEDRSSQELHSSWSSVNHFQPCGNQFANSVVQPIPSSVNLQNQPVGPESLFYWQATHPYFFSGDGNSQHHYPFMPTLPNVHSERDQHQAVLVDYGSSPASLKHANPLKVFPAPSRPPTMTRQEKLEKLKRRQQMQAMLAIQEQQQQFGPQGPRSDMYNADKFPLENQHPDTEGSTIEAEENLKVTPSMELSSPIERDDSNTVAMETENGSLEVRVLDQLQDVIGKLDIKVRLSIRDSLFRLAQSATQRHNTIDTSSTNNNMQCDGATTKEADEYNRLHRIPEVERDTNPMDRTVAHLLFHQPLEPSTGLVKDGEITGSHGFTKLICKPEREGINHISAGCISECSIEKQSLPQPSCMVSERMNVDQFQSNCYTNTLQNIANVEQENFGK
ncbi:hypothetical protein IFM89_013917 [Coptis chinensis]|uniref:Uncharacterized protein n=1 Tax=Coptis chinensis TaxID=261450 RepID=A0A835HEA4_9MAGN|nr:hypothetical protein IFM89_013917 [Coptis chinensis]